MKKYTRPVSSRQGNENNDAPMGTTSRETLGHNSGMSAEQAAEAQVWSLLREPAKRWSNPAYVAHVERQREMVDANLSRLADESLLSPAEVGAIGGMKSLERHRIITAACVLARRRIACDKELKGKTYVLAVDYIGIRSDNQHGRCVDSASAIAAYLGVSADRTENLLRDLRKKGILCHEQRRGHPGAYWMPYPRALLEWHDGFACTANSLIDAICGPGRAGGRPRITLHDSGRASSVGKRPAGSTGRFDGETPGEQDRGFEIPPVAGSVSPGDGHRPADTRSRYSDEEEDKENLSHQISIKDSLPSDPGDRIDRVFDSSDAEETRASSIADRAFGKGGNTGDTFDQISSCGAGPSSSGALIVPGTRIRLKTSTEAGQSFGSSTCDIFVPDHQRSLYRKWAGWKASNAASNGGVEVVDSTIANRALNGLIDSALRRHSPDTVEDALARAFTITQQKLDADEVHSAPIRYFTTVFESKLETIPRQRVIQDIALRTEIEGIQVAGQAIVKAKIAGAEASTTIAGLRVEAFKASVEEGTMRRQKTSDGKVHRTVKGSGGSANLETGADTQQPWIGDARVKNLGFLQIDGRLANKVLDSHPRAMREDVLAAFEELEAEDAHRETKLGKALDRPVLHVVEAAKKRLTRIVLYRERGTPEQVCGGEVAVDRRGQKLQTKWVAVSAAFVDDLIERHQAAAFGYSVDGMSWRPGSGNIEVECREQARECLSSIFHKVARSYDDPGDRYGPALQEEVEREIESRIKEMAMEGNCAYQERLLIAAKHHEECTIALTGDVDADLGPSKSQQNCGG